VADSISLNFPREPDSVPAARAALAHFEGRVDASRLYDASLCLSELVTNAVQHPAPEAEGEIELHLSLRESALRVQVVDPGSGFRPGKPTEGDERGWGLFIVDQLSTNWGTEPEPDRTIMWFEIASADEAEAGAGATDARAGRRGEDPPSRDEIASAVGRLRVRPVLH
jgi:anti-sigma regulatory factor (Ser/Thr protein kinase)